MCPSQESGVYTFMNLLPPTSIIEGDGSQGPSPLTLLMIFFFLHCKSWRTVRREMLTESCNSEMLVETAVGVQVPGRHPVFNILSLVCH